MGRKVILDSESFKALSSETRIKLLKLLDGRRMTLSDLAKRMELAKATVSSHLESLLNAGLVRKRDEGRKWIYYSLTRKGNAILHPEITKIYVVIALALVFLAVGITSMILWFTSADYGYDAFLSPAPENRAPYLGILSLLISFFLFVVIIFLRHKARRTVQIL